RNASPLTFINDLPLIDNTVTAQPGDSTFVVAQGLQGFLGMLAQAGAGLRCGSFGLEAQGRGNLLDCRAVRSVAGGEHAAFDEMGVSARLAQVEYRFDARIDWAEYRLPVLELASGDHLCYFLAQLLYCCRFDVGCPGQPFRMVDGLEKR